MWAGTYVSFRCLVFICDTGKELFVWIGRNASPQERRNAMPHAHVSKRTVHTAG